MEEIVNRYLERRKAAFYTRSNYVNNVLWLVFVLALLGLSTYKLIGALNPVADSLIIFAFLTPALLLMAIRATVRVIRIRLGLSKREKSIAQHAPD